MKEVVEFEVKKYGYSGTCIGYDWYNQKVYCPFKFYSDKPEKIELEDYSGFGFQSVEAVVYMKILVGWDKDGRTITVEDSTINTLGNEDLITEYMEGGYYEID